jgi:D-beta-D-heptose 7-phosphate kinase / D-beta-D-heptose 1-phosphate adenosyltransferase
MNESSVLSKGFSNVHIAVLGDVMLDSYLVGDTNRVSPEAPIPIVKVNSQRDVLGGAANVARNIVALGAKCTLLGAVGNDSCADKICDLLDEHAINNLLVRCDMKTTHKTRVLSSGQQLLRMDFEQDAPKEAEKQLLEFLQSIFAKVDILILSDYRKGVLNDPQLFINAARSAGVKVLVDPKRSDISLYKNADIITPNWSEYSALVQHLSDNDDQLKHAVALRDQANIGAMLVTRGADGMNIVTESLHHIPTRAQEVFDVSGAGDTVIATLALGLAAGISLVKSAELANAAAGLVVKKVGTATLSMPELRFAVLKVDSELSLISASCVADYAAALRAEGKKIVFTNGCFDILHPGHIRYLTESAKLGDVLIVALNDDESVQRLKGSSRPLNTLEGRATCVAGLRPVSWVTSFSEDTPLEIIKLIMPDVLVKGGDYTADQVVGADEVLQRGGRVELIDFVDGFSTTTLVEKITKQGEIK